MTEPDEFWEEWSVEFLVLVTEDEASDHDSAADFARGVVASGKGDVWVTAPRGGPSVSVGEVEYEELPVELEE